MPERSADFVIALPEKESRDRPDRDFAGKTGGIALAPEYGTPR